MIIKELRIKNYRNYESLDLHFDPRTNIFYGDNAQGKTNILEAIYLAGTTKSHRGSKDKEIIKFSREESHIELSVEKEGIAYDIDMHLKKNRTKGIAVNKVPIRKAVELIGFIHMVFFSPEDLKIIKSGPKERRRFIDRELCQMDPVYMHDLMEYNQLVTQRNLILRNKKYKGRSEKLLDTYDMQIVDRGKRVIAARHRFLEELEELVRPIYRHLTGEREDIRIKYEPSVTQESIEEVFFRNREQDIRLQTTTSGPHRDDMSVIGGEIDLRTYGSQGQQRTAALSLKMAQIELVRQRINDTPILLLDDVLSELDQNRQEYLLESIDHTQTFLTCTGVDDFIRSHVGTTRTYHVEDGRVSVEGE